MTCEASNFTGVTQAEAYAIYSCQRLEWEKDRAAKAKEASTASDFVRNAIAIAQQVAAFYMADRQLDAAKLNLNKLNEIRDQQMYQSRTLFDAYENAKACDKKQTDEACEATVPPPDYTLTLSRMRAQVAPQFNQARRQTRRRYGVHCRAASCSELSRIDIEEARTVSAMAEAAYRKEESIYKLEVAGIKAHRMNVLQHVKGMAVSSGGLLSSAANVTQAASQINPLSGYTQAINQAAGYWMGRTYDNSSGVGGSAFNSMRFGQGTSNFSNAIAPSSNGVSSFDITNNDGLRFASPSSSMVNGGTGVAGDPTGGSMFDGGFQVDRNDTPQILDIGMA
jgi:hypothetical protein